MLVICGDDDHQDTYVGETMRLTRNRCDTGALPIVRVLQIVDYPRQSSILYGDVVSETMPIPEGTITRLRIYRAAFPEDIKHDTWDDALKDALMRAVSVTRDPAQRTILLRHIMGVHKFERPVLTIPADEVEEDT